MAVLSPTYSASHGVTVKTYPAPDAVPESAYFNGSFRTFGGTETTVNGLYSVEDTATIETWYRPDIKADSRILLRETGEIYEMFGRPEDIGLRHQYLVMKVKRVESGA